MRRNFAVTYLIISVLLVRAMIRDIDKAHSQAGALGNADNGVLASKRKVVDMVGNLLFQNKICFW
jgi:hypothetical protein